MAQGINLVIGADVKQAVAELQKLNGFVNNWSSQMRGAIMSAFSFYAIYNGLRQTVESIAEFQAEMSKLKALTGETGVKLGELRNNALQLAGAYRAITVAQAEVQLSKAGFTTQEILESTKAVTMLATAAGVDLPKATDIAGATLRGFGLDAKEMQRVTDVMAHTLNATQADLADFGEAMKYVAPNAKAVNVSLEETSAMLGVLSNAGIKGSMAGTALRRLFQDLSKDGRPVSERLAELGKNGLNAADAFQEVGRIGSTALLILANSTGKISELSDELKNVNGETEKMAGTMMDNLAGDWKNLSAEWDRAIQKGTWLSEALRMVVQSSKELLRTTVTGGSLTSKMSLWEQVKAALGLDISEDKSGWTAGGTGVGKKPVINDVGSGPQPNFGKGIKDDTFSGAWIDRQIDKVSAFGDVVLKNVKPLEEWGDKIHYADQEYVKFAFSADEAADAVAATTEAIDPDTQAKIDESVDAWKKWKDNLISLEMTTRQKANMIRSSIVGAFSGLGRAIGNALSGANLEAQMLGFLGGIAIQVGEMAVAIGVAMLGIEAALKGLGPFGAIAAGTALIALGTYASNRAAEIGSQVNGGGGGGSSSLPRFADRDLSLNGEWRIRGADLVYVLDKQGYRSSVLGG